MSDENAPPLTLRSPAPPDDGGAEDLIEFVDLPLPEEEADARAAYLAECPAAEPAAETATADEAGEAEASTTLPATVAALPAGRNAAPTPPERAGTDGDKPESLFGKAMDSLGPHLDELRRRLVIAAVAFIPAFAVGLFFYQRLWDVLLLPLADASPHLLRFQALGPSDGLILTMQIAFAFALLVSLPVWISQVWCFVAPALTAGERRWLHLAFGSGGLLFFLGALAAYFYAVPLALGYLLPLNQSLTGWENSFTGSGYVDFVLTCCIAFGVAFELPLVMLVLGWVGLLTPEGIKAWWRVVVLAVFVVSAIMTPPDPFSQLLLAVPLLGLFFLGYWLVKWTARKQE